jgi:tetratricopeptide (TPR) repeat protein
MMRLISAVILCSLLLFSVAVCAQRGTNSTPAQVVVRLYSRSNLPTTTIKVELSTELGTPLAHGIVDSPGMLTLALVTAGQYTLEVSGPEIQPVTEQFRVLSGEGLHIETVELKPKAEETQSSGGIPGSLVRDKNVPRKAQAELDKAAEASNHHQWAKAVKSYNKALELCPQAASTYVYLAGALLRLGDKTRAREALSKAIVVKPDYAPPYIMLARLYAGDKDYAQVIVLLRRTLSFHGDDAEALFLLSNAELQAGKYSEAIVDARKVHTLPHRGYEAAHFICGLALQQQGDRVEAAEEYRIFLKEAPESTMAARARETLTSLTSPAIREVSVHDLPAAITARELTSMTAGLPLPPLPRKSWAPPDVDEIMPPVRNDTPCDLLMILRRTSSKVQELASNLKEFAATERIEQVEVENSGSRRKPVAAQFNYVADIHENGPGNLKVEEYRNSTTAFNIFPSKLATTGMAAFALIFHPAYIGSFTVTCEGLSSVQDQPAWQLHFSEYPDARLNFRAYRVGGKFYPVKLKGRAWISADTDQVLKLETDLLEPIHDILQWEHVTITYHSVAFPKRKADLFLPETAEIYMNYRGHNYHDVHKLSDFQLFSVDTSQQTEPPESTQLPDDEHEHAQNKHQP